MTTMLECALDYARAGFAVFPVCTPEESKRRGHPERGWGKTAAIEGWQKRATSDLEQVRRFWGEEAPANCNIGHVPSLAQVLMPALRSAPSLLPLTL